MNRIYRLALMLTLLFSLSLPAYKATAQYNAYVSYNDFYENLAPYGQWIQDPQYGYVWSPDVDGGFRPYYTNGYWAMTNYGNTWISDYPWGWACFHYGRWTYDPYYGWLWIPGSDWGPAWVSWRYGEDNYGWAPLGPGYNPGAGYGDYSCPNDWWVFIPPQYIYSGGYYRYWYGPRGNSTIIQNTTIIHNTYVNNNVTYVTGPRATDIEHITHQAVQVYNIGTSNNLTTRVHNNTIKMYRPARVAPVASNAEGRNVAPPNVITASQPIGRPQAVSSNGTAPAFRSSTPKSQPADAVGAHFNEPVKAAPAPRRADNHAYQWDVNKPVPQPQTHEVPEYHGQQPNMQTPQEARPQPRPAYQQSAPQQSSPQPRPAYQQSAPQRPAPQQTALPAPSAPRPVGGRR